MMFEQIELVLLWLGIFVLVFILVNREFMKQLPSWNLLIAAYLMFFVSWIFTNLEEIFLPSLLNLFQHLILLIGGVLIAIWCWMVFGKEVRDSE